MSVTTVRAAPLTDPLLLAWEERLHRVRRNPRTILNFRLAGRHLENYLSALGVTMRNAEPWHLEEFFASLDLKPGTKRKYLADIRAAYKYAQRRGSVSQDPTFDVQIERIPDEEPVIVPNHCLREMKACAPSTRAWLVLHLLAYAGLRRHEIRKLIWADVLLADDTLRVLGKGGKLRLVPIHPALGEVLAQRGRDACPDDYVVRSRVGSAPVADDTFREIVREFTTAYTPHDFRRTVASSLALNDVSDGYIDKIMGWAPRTVGRRYYINVAGPQLQRAILKLYADDPI